MGIDISSYKSRASSGSLPTSTATGGGGGPAVPSGQYLCDLTEAQVTDSQKGAKQLVLKFTTKKVVDLRENLEEGQDEASLIGKPIKWYFIQPDESKQDWVDRLIGDLVALCDQIGVDKAKLFTDSDGDDAKSVLEIYTNFAAAVQKPLLRKTLEPVVIDRVRQLKDATRFNHAIVKGAVSEAPKASPSKNLQGL